MLNRNEQKIRNLANYISVMYNLSPPVKFESVFTGGHCIYKEELLGQRGDGYTNFEEDPPVVCINSEIEYEPRKRFTTAHEIGHVFIPWHSDVRICQMSDVYGQQRQVDIQEYEANIFASELLMPTSWLKEIINDWESNNSRDVETLIKTITNRAGVSIMACLFAIQPALKSGNVIVVSGSRIPYGRRFIADRTYTTRFKGLDVAQFCASFCKFKSTFTLGYYTIAHYQLLPCPSEEQIKHVYLNNDSNIEETINEISLGNPQDILHFARTIFEAVTNQYYSVVQYHGIIISNISSPKCNIRIAEDEPEGIDSIRAEIRRRFDENGEIDIGSGMSIIWAKENSNYKLPDVELIKLDSRKLLKNILSEIYGDDEGSAKSKSINGIIGSANGSNKTSNEEELFEIFKIRLENHKHLAQFTKHDMYDEFLLLRVREIMSRRIVSN